MVRLMREILLKVILAAVLISIPGIWSVSALSVESSSHQEKKGGISSAKLN
jgi:hypothetical protein